MRQEEFVAAFLAFVLWYARYEFSGTTNVGSVARSGRREAVAAQKSYGCIPPWAFGLVWFVVYGANATGTYLYWREGPQSGNYLAVWALILGNVIVNKSWSAIFADARAYTAGAITIFFNFALAVALVIVLGVEGGANETLGYWPFVLFLPYTVWLAVAAVLNVRFVRAYKNVSFVRRGNERGREGAGRQ